MKDLEVGSKATVKTLEAMQKEFGVEGDFDNIVIGDDAFIVEEMSQFCGQTLTIATADDDVYTFEEDDADWNFTRGMLET